MYKNKTLLCLLFPQAFLIAFTAACGLLFAATYAQETFNWRIQSIGQDVVDLFLALPVLIVSAVAAWRGSRVGAFVYGGTQLFLLYTYLIYCFSVHFNYLFIPYCLTLGLTFYSLIYFILLMWEKRVSAWFQYKTPVRFTSIYFFIIAVLFSLLWLKEAVPASLDNKAPASLLETGLFTNPVHVIDLALFLPGLIIVGVLLYRRRPAGFLWAPVMLVFFVLMDINIAVLVTLMYKNGLQAAPAVAWAMVFLAVFSVAALYFIFKSMNPALQNKDTNPPNGFTGFTLFL